MQKIRKVQIREPGLIDLTNFIEDEMVLANDPLFSREAVGQYEEKPLFIYLLFINHYFSSNTNFSTYTNSNRLDNYKNPVAL